MEVHMAGGVFSALQVIGQLVYFRNSYLRDTWRKLMYVIEKKLLQIQTAELNTFKSVVII